MKRILLDASRPARKRAPREDYLAVVEDLKSIVTTFNEVTKKFEDAEYKLNKAGIGMPDFDKCHTDYLKLVRELKEVGNSYMFIISAMGIR